jgi:hypothetical protein
MHGATLKNKKMYFGFMDVILMRSDHQHVSANYFQDGKNKY